MIRKTRTRRGGFKLPDLKKLPNLKTAFTTGFDKTKAAVNTGFNKTQKAVVCTKLWKDVEAGKAAQKKIDERRDTSKECRPPAEVAAERQADAAAKVAAKQAGLRAQQESLAAHKEKKETAAKKAPYPPISEMDMAGGRKSRRKGHKSRRKGRKSRRKGTRKGMRRKTARRAYKRKH